MVSAPPSVLQEQGAPRAPRWPRATRLARFALTGATAGGFQLGLMRLLTSHGWHAVTANAVAFLLAAQLNFALSNTFTWRDRDTSRPLWRRWLAFHGSIAGMAVVNMVVFTLSRSVLPDLEAAALGIAVAAAGNFLLGDRLVFRSERNIDRGVEQVAA